MPTKWNKEDSKKKIEALKKNYLVLQSQMKREYEAWDNYVAMERVRRASQKFKLTPRANKIWKVNVRLIEKQMNVWMSILVSDTKQTEFIPMWWFNQRETANNINKVAEYDYEAMWMFNLNMKWWWDIWEVWLWARTIDWWDALENKPIPSRLDPLSLIPDPQNSVDSKMDFLWINTSLRAWQIHQDPKYFNTENLKLKGSNGEEVILQDIIDSAWGYGSDIDKNQIVWIYHHFIRYDWHLYLTTWWNDRQLLIRIIEVEPKTEIQKKDLSRVRIPVTFARRKPIPWRFFGSSIYDDLEEYQDQMTILKNLLAKQARREALWPDIVVNSKYIDPLSIAKRSAWARVLTYTGLQKDIPNPAWLVQAINTPWGNLNTTDYALNTLQRDADSIVWGWDLNTGVSPAGNQTKAEIQTLQKNINQLLSYSTTLITYSDKEFWEMWYEMYVYNLKSNSTKYIVLTRGNQVDANEFKRKDFILDCPVIVKVKSKAQEAIKKKNRFAMRQVLANTILPNLKQGSHNFNEYLRNLALDWELSQDEVMIYIPLSLDEQLAQDGLVLLNNWEMPSEPKPWEDYQTFIDIYKLAPDSEEKENIIFMYEQALKAQMQQPQIPMPWENPEQGWVANVTNSGQMWNQLIQDMATDNQAPSLQDVAWV